ENRSVEKDVLTAGKLRIEARSQFQKGRHTAADFNASGGRPNNARNHSQECAFTRTVLANDAEAATSIDRNTGVIHGPERLVIALPAESEQFLQMIRRVPIDPETLGNPLGSYDRHADIIHGRG